MTARRKSFNAKNVTEQTLVEMIVQVRAIAAANPHFVYKSHMSSGYACTYKRDRVNKQGCIIGAALRNLGFALPKDGPTARMHLMRVGFDHTKNRKVQWLNHVQQLQDQSVSWGDAVALANDYFAGA